MNEITKEESEALEGMFFSEYDLSLHLKDSSPKTLADHLNSYILQAYRIGKSDGQNLYL